MESTISRFYAGMKPAKACNPFLPGFVTIDWTAALFYIFTGFIGFKAKALEKTADAVCSGAFLLCIRYEYRFVEEDVEAGRVCGCTSLLVQESVIKMY